MKSITVHFEDKEFEKLKEAKKNTSWHDFLLNLIKKNKNGVKSNDCRFK